GTITLDSDSDAGFQAVGSLLTVTSGTLTNNGEINFIDTASFGAFATHTVSADIVNNGSVHIDQSTAFTKSGGSFINHNSVTIASGETIALNNSRFTLAGGTLSGSGSFTGGTFVFSGGEIRAPRANLVDSTLTVASTRPASLLLQGSCTLIGDVAA